MKNGQKLLGITFVLIISISSCGRKQKNIFFCEEQNLPRANKLALPTVRGVAVHQKANGYLISWQEPLIPSTPTPSMPYLCTQCFAGYNVYRLVRTNIIPKNSCNEKPIRTKKIFDQKLHCKNRPTGYLIRTVFFYDNLLVEGPNSLIVRTKNLEN
jgi:hypothetical protein